MTGIANCTDLLRQMVAIPSDSGHEAAFAAFLEQFLREELEMRTELHHIEGGSCNVTGHWETGLPARRRLILGGHIDTVPPAAHWKTDPYQLTQQGDELHGLGAADMKGGLAAQLLVLKRLKEDRETLDVEFAFAGLADEERYSVGAHAYVEWTKNCRPPVQDTVFLMGEPHFDNIVIGAAGKVLLSLHIQGRKGHAAAPESGVNAIECMAALLEAIRAKYGPRYQNGLCGSFCCLKIESIYPGYSLTIPESCSCLLNKQLLPTEDVHEFCRDIERLYQEQVGAGLLSIRREIPSYPAYQLEPSQKYVANLTAFLREQFHREPELRINQSVSDGNILYNSLNIPAILFGPHGVAFHTEGEYVQKSSLARYMEELYGYICQEYRRDRHV